MGFQDLGIRDLGGLGLRNLGVGPKGLGIWGSGVCGLGFWGLEGARLRVRGPGSGVESRRPGVKRFKDEGLGIVVSGMGAWV